MSRFRSVVGLIAMFVLVGSVAVAAQWSARAQEEATIDEIIENPDNFVGQTVTVTGTVTVILDPQAFTVQGEQEPVGDETLLVVAAEENIPAGLDDGMTVTITGEVQRFDPDDPAQFEDIGLDPEAEAFAGLEDDPLIIAETITVVQAGTPVASPAASPAASPTATATATPSPSPTPSPVPQVTPRTGEPRDGGVSELLIVALVALGVFALVGGVVLRRMPR